MSDQILRCPRCGGEMKNNMCVSCGYIDQGESQVFSTPEIPSYEPADLTPEVADIYETSAGNMMESEVNVDPVYDATPIYETDALTGMSYESEPAPAQPMPEQPVQEQPMPEVQPYGSAAPMPGTQPYGGQPMPGDQPYGGQPMPGAHSYGNPNAYGNPGAPYGNPNAAYGDPNAAYGNPGAPYGNPYVGPDGRFDPNLVPGYTQTNSNKSTGIIIVFVLILLVIITIGVIGFAASLNKYVKDKDTDRYEDWDYDDDDALFDDGGSYDDEFDYGDFDYDYDEGDPDSYYKGNNDFVDDIDWNDKAWKKEAPVKDKEEIIEMGEYTRLMNCIDKDVPYKLTFKAEERTDKDNGVCLRAQYYQIEGTGHDDEINDVLREEALYYINDFDEYKDEYYDMFDVYLPGFMSTTDAYVTYNDEDKISIVYDSEYHTAMDAGRGLMCINIDLKNGRVLDNTDILDYDEDFVKFLKQRMIDQMGEGCGAESLEDEYMLDRLQDEYGVIFFYTPLGAECGVNYTNYSVYGWITATITDEEVNKYSKRL